MYRNNPQSFCHAAAELIREPSGARPGSGIVCDVVVLVSVNLTGSGHRLGYPLGVEDWGTEKGWSCDTVLYGDGSGSPGQLVFTRNGVEGGGGVMCGVAGAEAGSSLVDDLTEIVCDIKEQEGSVLVWVVLAGEVAIQVDLLNSEMDLAEIADRDGASFGVMLCVVGTIEVEQVGPKSCEVHGSGREGKQPVNKVFDLGLKTLVLADAVERQNIEHGVEEAFHHYLPSCGECSLAPGALLPEEYAVRARRKGIGKRISVRPLAANGIPRFNYSVLGFLGEVGE